jgi:hypothetical protein
MLCVNNFENLIESSLNSFIKSFTFEVSIENNDINSKQYGDTGKSFTSIFPIYLVKKLNFSDEVISNTQQYINNYYENKNFNIEISINIFTINTKDNSNSTIENDLNFKKTVKKMIIKPYYLNEILIENFDMFEKTKYDISDFRSLEFSKKNRRKW